MYSWNVEIPKVALIAGTYHFPDHIDCRFALLHLIYMLNRVVADPW